MVRARHYSRVSAIKKIIVDLLLVARDQNKVFVELADARRLSPADAEEKYDLGDGKGNGYIEFDIEEERLQRKFNKRLGFDEYFIVGDVDLRNRNAEPFSTTGGPKLWKPKQ